MSQPTISVPWADEHQMTLDWSRVKVNGELATDILAQRDHLTALCLAQVGVIQELTRRAEKLDNDRRRYFRRLEAVRGLTTHKHETMAQFVSRVRSCIYARNF